MNVLLPCRRGDFPTTSCEGIAPRKRRSVSRGKKLGRGSDALFFKRTRCPDSVPRPPAFAGRCSGHLSEVLIEARGVVEPDLISHIEDILSLRKPAHRF